MAMSHALLLVSLFFLPVLLGDYVPFEYCKNIGHGHDYVDVNSVWVDQYFDNMVEIQVGGLAKKNIPVNNTFVYVNIKHGVEEKEFEIIRYGLCDCDVLPPPCDTNSVIEAGEFFLDLHHVPHDFQELKYLYSVSVRTEKEEWPPIIYTCVDFYVERHIIPLTLASA